MQTKERNIGESPWGPQTESAADSSPQTQSRIQVISSNEDQRIYSWFNSLEALPMDLSDDSTSLPPLEHLLSSSASGTSQGSSTRESAKEKKSKRNNNLSWDALRLRLVKDEVTTDKRLEHFKSVLVGEDFSKDSASLQSMIIDIDLSNAIKQLALIMWILDRWHIKELFAYNHEFQWNIRERHQLPSRSKKELILPKPCLVVSFTLTALMGPDISAPIPPPINDCIRPDGSVHNCFPFLFIEPQSKENSYEVALMTNLHSASQALLNIYIWMLQAGDQEVFFHQVRIFSIVLNAREIRVRVHRAIANNNSLSYHFDDIVVMNDYSKEEAYLLLKNILTEYGEKELHEILRNTFEKVSRMEDE